MIARSRPVYRIGIDARFYQANTGGLGRYSRELIHYLSFYDRVNEYYIFLTEEGMREWQCENPNFHPVVTTVAHYTPAEQTTFLRLLYSYHLDLVHFLNFNHPVAYQRPFVVTLHDLTLLHKPEASSRSAKSKVRRLAFEFVFKRAVRKAKKVIAISEHTAHDAEKSLNVPHAKMEVVYEGVTPPYEIPFGAKKQIQDYLGSKTPYILFVSQWRAHKGIITLLGAFARLKERYHLPYKLVLLGRQDAASDEMQETLSSSPVAEDIITPGFAPDELLPALYTYASAFVMPSEYEGFGLPVLEALSYGTPTIVANNSSLPEVGGDAVLYFKTRDAEELTEKLHEILTNTALVAELRTKGFKQIEKFRWENTAAQTHQVYLSVLEKRR
jgi:glycosyltransferase involved in cell wall biosynthesis